jgi:hypothetical protein
MGLRVFSSAELGETHRSLVQSDVSTSTWED